MKVLLVSNVYLVKSENSKITNFVTEQVNAMSKHCHDVKYTIYTIHGRDSRWNYVSSYFEIKKMIKSGEYDMIHIHHGMAGLFMLLAGKVDIPVIMTLHGGDIHIEQKHWMQVFLSKKIVKRCDAVITLNLKMDAIVKRYNRNTRIIPCSIDMDFFKPAEKRREANSIKKIIFPSFRTRAVKNYPLFEATIRLLKEKYGFKIDTIEFNNISRKEVRDYYLQSDLVLLTSFSEGSPGVVKEAMACNLPVVSTNVGDVAVNLEGVKGCAVSKEMNAEELAVLCSKSLKGEIDGIDGREKIVELGLDDQTICYKLHELYKKVLLNHFA